MEGRRSGVISICLVLVLGGCGDGGDGGDGEDGAELGQGELQALLRDDPVMQPGGAAAATNSALAPSLKPRPTFFPLGRWEFDDCDPGRAELLNDSSFSANPAYRSLGVTCTEGVIGQAVALGEREDLVYVPDQPYFQFDQGLTVAGWSPIQAAATFASRASS